LTEHNIFNAFKLKKKKKLKEDITDIMKKF